MPERERERERTIHFVRSQPVHLPSMKEGMIQTCTAARASLIVNYVVVSTHRSVTQSVLQHAPNKAPESRQRRHSLGRDFSSDSIISPRAKDLCMHATFIVHS